MRCVICHPLANDGNYDVPEMTRQHIADAHPRIAAAARAGADDDDRWWDRCDRPGCTRKAGPSGLCTRHAPRPPR